MLIYGAGSLDDIRKCTELGVAGILTNPQGFDQYFEGTSTLREITEMIAEATDLPAFIQVHGPTTDAIVARATELNAVAPDRIGFKIIADPKGFAAIHRLQRKGIRCIATALFSVAQASVAANVGAFGICPFISRARAIGMDPFAALSTVREGYDRLPDPPQIIAVSMKGLGDVELALEAGADATAMRYPLIVEMMQHPLSEKAETLFAKNWAKVKGENTEYLNGLSTHDGEAE
jgi:transaldolase